MSRQRLVIRQGKLKEIKIKNEIINRNRRNERDKYGKQSEEKTAQITLCFCNKLIMAIKKMCFLHSLIAVSQTAER